MRNLFFPHSYHRLAVAAVVVGTLVLADANLASAQVVARSTHADAGAGVYRSSRPGRVTRPRVSRSVRRSGSLAAPRPVFAAASVDSDVWAKLRRCESGGRYDINTGNGFYGAYQFVPSTWRGLGYAGIPHQAPPEVQDEAARRLQARSGWGQWPVCSRRIGLR
jgi:hypothetical protein